MGTLALKTASILALLPASATAASLDQLEVGGLHGTPASDGPTAVWWNPAMMSADDGTRVLVEIAPTIGRLGVERESGIDRGEDEFNVTSAVPFVGVVTDAGIEGLGIGLAFFVPYGRAGTSDRDPGPGRSHLRFADIQALHFSLGLSYDIADVFGIGIAGTYINARYSSRSDRLFLPQLADAVAATIGQSPEDLYPPEALEDPRYLIHTGFGPLQGHGGAVQVGVYGRPHPRWILSLSFYSGARIEHEGGAALDFDCPPEDDLFGRLGATREGLCNADIIADATNTFAYPMRVNAGVRFTPVDDTHIELMGGWVNWSQFEDYEFFLSNPISLNTVLSDTARAGVTGERLFARENHDSFWLGADAKVKVHDLVRVDGRLAYDHHAVPDRYLSPNNADFNAVHVGAGVEVRTGPVPLYLGVSFLERIWIPRDADDTVWDVTLDPDERLPGRVFYPSMNGRYTGNVHRIGLSVRGEFDWPRR